MKDYNVKSAQREEKQEKEGQKKTKKRRRSKVKVQTGKRCNMKKLKHEKSATGKDVQKKKGAT